MTKKAASVLLFGAAMAAGLLAGCSPVGMLNAMTPRSTYTRMADVAYGTNPRQRLDVYLPAGAGMPTAEHPGHLPVVVFIYGGSWQNGDRTDYTFVGEALASRGFIAVLPDYRTYPETIFPGFVDDAATAVSWAHAHAASLGGDPRRLFLMGHSAGAEITGLLVTDRRYLASVGLSKQDIAGMVGLAGPYDFLPLRDATLEKIFPPAVRDASQPINFVQGNEPPMFLGVSKNDKVVDPGNTTRFAARLSAAGDAVEVRQYHGLSHALTIGVVGAPLRALAPVLADLTSFIRRTAQHIPSDAAAPVSTSSNGKAATPAQRESQTGNGDATRVSG